LLADRDRRGGGRGSASSLLSRRQHGSIGLVRQPAARVPMVRQCRLSAKGAGGTSHNAAWSSLNRAHGGAAGRERPWLGPVDRASTAADERARGTDTCAAHRVPPMLGIT